MARALWVSGRGETAETFELVIGDGRIRRCFLEGGDRDVSVDFGQQLRLSVRSGPELDPVGVIGA